MKFKPTVFSIIICFALATSLFGQADTLTIIHVNDTHSHLVPWGPKNTSGEGTIGGMARIASTIGSLKMSSPNPILLHAGDVFGGDFMFNKFFGVPEFQIMAALGFDAMTLGNHEFNYYPSTLVHVLNTAGFPALFPVLCANMDYSAFPDIDPFVQDYIIKDYGNTKVGIFGVTTTETNTIAHPEPIVFTSDSVAAARVVTELTSQGCDLIICLSHLGLLSDQLLATMVPGIDIIVGGHSHTYVPAPIPVPNAFTGEITYVVQANWGGTHVGSLSVAVNGSDFTIVNYQIIPIDDSIPAEPSTEATINGLIATVESDIRYGPVYSQIVAQAATMHEQAFSAGEYKDSKVGNLITDALRDTANTDIAFAANGFIRQAIYEGDLTEADIFQVLPEGLNVITGYGSTLSTFGIDGISIIAGLEFSVAMIEYTDTFFLQTSGLTFEFNSNNQPGSRVDYASIRINGQPLDVNARYTATINSDLVPMLELTGIDTVYNVQEIANSEYAVVREYIKKHSPIDTPGSVRIRDVARTAVNENHKPATTPAKYHLSQNYPNPFNPVTSFHYVIPEASDVRVSIYNLLGQEIRTLVNEYQAAGNYQMTWDGKNNNGEQVASDVYLYRLKAGHVVMARKMLLSR